MGTRDEGIRPSMGTMMITRYLKKELKLLKYDTNEPLYRVVQRLVEFYVENGGATSYKLQARRNKERTNLLQEK